MIMKIFLKPLLLIFSLVPLISCSFLFKPDHMTIEYDEEVKLHDGEMIWVHITRHYIQGGGKEISEMFRGGGKNVIPTHVELSWDTGFEGVGRKSVYFKRQIFVVNKINNEWYIYGASDKYMKSSYGQSTSCNDVGTSYFNGANCLVKIDSSGNFSKSSEDEISKLTIGNMLYSYSFDETKVLENKNISWQQKISIQSGKPKEYQIVNKQLFLNKGK